MSLSGLNFSMSDLIMPVPGKQNIPLSRFDDLPEPSHTLAFSVLFYAARGPLSPFSVGHIYLCNSFEQCSASLQFLKSSPPAQVQLSQTLRQRGLCRVQTTVLLRRDLCVIFRIPLNPWKIFSKTSASWGTVLSGKCVQKVFIPQRVNIYTYFSIY